MKRAPYRRITRTQFMGYFRANGGYRGKRPRYQYIAHPLDYEVYQSMFIPMSKGAQIMGLKITAPWVSFRRVYGKVGRSRAY